VIVDSSAFVAIVGGEPESERFLEAMRDAGELWMPTPTALEVSIVLGPNRLDRAMDFLSESGIRLADFTPGQLLVAQQAHASYGRGSGSPAKLNFGDCMVYALAKVMDQPLLFKGNDFNHTDVEPAIRD